MCKDTVCSNLRISLSVHAHRCHFTLKLNYFSRKSDTVFRVLIILTGEFMKVLFHLLLSLLAKTAYTAYNRRPIILEIESLQQRLSRML
jgi:hypothetical protein